VKILNDYSSGVAAKTMGTRDLIGSIVELVSECTSISCDIRDRISSGLQEKESASEKPSPCITNDLRVLKSNVQQLYDRLQVIRDLL